MTFPAATRIVAAAATLSCAGALSAEQPTSEPSSRPAARLSPERAAELIGQLGHRRWADRDLATSTLRHLGTRDLLPALEGAYKQNPSPEIRLRIKDVVEHITLKAEMRQGGGFLGIRQRLIDHRDQLTIPAGQGGIRVVDILPGTAADAAGLIEHDVILGLNGERFKQPLNLNDFPKRISSIPPGTNVSLIVLRNGKEIDVQATLGVRPLEHVSEQSPEFLRAQEVFAKLWHDRFDPNDKNVGPGSPDLGLERPAIQILRDLNPPVEE